METSLWPENRGNLTCRVAIHFLGRRHGCEKLVVAGGGRNMWGAQAQLRQTRCHPVDLGTRAAHHGAPRRPRWNPVNRCSLAWSRSRHLLPSLMLQPPAKPPAHHVQSIHRHRLQHRQASKGWTGINSTVLPVELRWRRRWWNTGAAVQRTPLGVVDVAPGLAWLTSVASLWDWRRRWCWWCVCVLCA